MSDNIPPELAYAVKIWWDPIWTIMDKAGIAEQRRCLRLLWMRRHRSTRFRRMRSTR
jgi:hypothetical protein